MNSGGERAPEAREPIARSPRPDAKRIAGGWNVRRDPPRWGSLRFPCGVWCRAGMMGFGVATAIVSRGTFPDEFVRKSFLPHRHGGPPRPRPGRDRPVVLHGAPASGRQGDPADDRRRAGRGKDAREDEALRCCGGRGDGGSGPASGGGGRCGALGRSDRPLRSGLSRGSPGGRRCDPPWVFKHPHVGDAQR